MNVLQNRTYLANTTELNTIVIMGQILLVVRNRIVPALTNAADPRGEILAVYAVEIEPRVLAINRGLQAVSER